MQVGGLSLLAPTAAGAPPLDLVTFRALLRSRLAGALALRRRLAELPFDLARPYWTELAPEAIDLDAHVERTTLPTPGGWRELAALVAWELAQPLDRARPLWQMTWVEGLALPDAPPGTVAVISRVHHAAIDGVSGAELLAVLFDRPAAAVSGGGDRTGEGGADGRAASGGAPSAEPPLVAPAGLPARADEPGALELLAQAGRELVAMPRELSGVVGRTLLGLAAGAWSRLRQEETAPLLFAAPPSLLNRPLGRALSFAPAVLDLGRIRALKNAAAATVNDVVLTVCAGALRGWLLEQDALPDEPLVAMVPVSVRVASEQGQAGNLVSAMLVALATDEPVARTRLARIRDAARAAKSTHQAIGARTLLDSAALLPFALSGLAVRLYSRLHLAGQHRPWFNLVITNVPGPPQPLTVGGRALLAHFGTAPLFDGLRLILPVLSYAGRVTIGVTADRDLLPDAAAFAARIEGALDELEEALAVDTR